MTPEQAKELLPVFTAYGEGKTIQGKNYKGEWSVFDEPDFSQPPERYRIRPEPQWRPWTMAEINQLPIDTLFKWGTNIGVIVGIWPHEVHVRFPCFHNWYTVEGLLNNWQHSTDHGQSWKKCGVEIGEGT